VAAPLVMGRFKGRDGERLHLLYGSCDPVRNQDKGISGVLVIRREEQGFLYGPTFCDSAG
jgi:hypothetical protein